MRLIFIRHAEPDYEHNTLTEKGFREARILSDRICTWTVDQFFVSPLERARLTIAPALEKLHRTAVTCEWLKEFSYRITDPTTGIVHVPWDFMPEYWTKDPLFYDKDHFWQQEVLRSNPAYEPAVMAMRAGLDDILATYGYHRLEGYYRTEDDKVRDDDGLTIVLSAHLGAICEAVGYLTGISPVVLQETFFLAPTSVTILNFEKRMPGAAQARVQVMGDTRHLHEAGEPISYYGAFSQIDDL